MSSPSTPGARAPGRGSGRIRLVAVAAVLQLLAGVLAAVLVDGAGSTPPTAARARAVPSTSVAPSPPPVVVDVEQREQQVAQLLAARSAAVLGRDRAAFLATVDPSATALRERQAATFDALAAVPLGTFTYDLDARQQRPSDVRLDTRYGRGQWWAPDVLLSYGLEGFDERPTVVEHHLTFVRRAGRWLLGADDDFAAIGLETPRALWDRGPVVAVRAPGTLVLGHPGSEPLMRNVAQLTAAAIPAVTEVWGTWQRRVVVVVPDDAEEMAGLLGNDGDLSRIAAVATAELTAGGEYDPVGDRVLVNPEPFSTLSQLGRQVVLTHEVTHVASRRATGPAVPSWLAEGLADHVAYRDVDLPLSVSARELRSDVRAGRLPERLPLDTDFDGSNVDLAQAYEQAWLAVRLIAQRDGEQRLLRFYRAVGAARGVEPEDALATALRDELGTTLAELTADWRAALRRQLA